MAKSRSKSKFKSAAKSAGRSERPQVVSVSNPSELVASVPYFVGFHPRESLVVLGLRPPRGRLGATLRLDLPTAPAHAHQASRMVSRYLSSNDATQAILLVYTGATDPAGGLACRFVIDAVRAELTRHGITLRDAVLVRDDRWWSYLCTDAGCCPPVGNPVREPGDSPVAAAMAVEGRVVHGDRDDLLAMLSRADAADDAAITAALDRASEVSIPARDAKVLDEEMADRRARWVEGTVDRSLLPDCAAALGLALVHSVTRDRATRACLGDDVDAYEPLWLELTRRLPAPLDAVPATLLGLIAYLRGDGAFAGICFDHARESNPAYSFAELLDTQVRAGTHPARVRPLLCEAFGAAPPE